VESRSNDWMGERIVITSVEICLNRGKSHPKSREIFTLIGGNLCPYRAKAPSKSSEISGHIRAISKPFALL
jgi:hypothetical protein